MQLLGRHDVVGNGFDQRRDQRRDLADPRRHGGPIELDAFTRVDAGLPIEWEMVAVFADQNVRQQARSSLAALDRQRWHRALHHTLAAPARERRADVPNYLEMAGDVIENAGDILADLAHLAAAHRAGAAWLVHDVARRKMSGQRPAFGLLPIRQ
jgi:hypothetical protein